MTGALTKAAGPQIKTKRRKTEMYSPCTHGVFMQMYIYIYAHAHNSMLGTFIWGLGVCGLKPERTYF